MTWRTRLTVRDVGRQSSDVIGVREGTEVETTHTWTTGSTFEFDEDGVHDEKEKDGERTEPWLTP